MDITNTAAAVLTTTLRNGAVVVAKRHGANIYAATYANLTQARRSVEKLAAAGVIGEVVQWGRPFFVRVEGGR